MDETEAGAVAASPGWFMFVCKLLVALGALAAVLFWMTGPAAFWLESGLWTRVGRLSAIIAAAAAVYFGALYLLGFRLADFNRRDVDD